jgi:hypothetical protein
MDNKIKLKPNIIKPYSYKNINNKNTNNKNIHNSNSSLNEFMNIYFDHKITSSIYESIVKKL